MPEPLRFILAGCHGGDPMEDLPSFPGPWRWFVDRWTSPMPVAEALSEAIGKPVADWPLAFDEQMAQIEAGPCVLLVRGDPLVATPHQLLVNRAREAGHRVMVRRRLGVAHLAATVAGAKPRVLPASACEQIAAHLAEGKQPLLVVRDHDEQSLEMPPAEGWDRRWLVNLGRPDEAVHGAHPGATELLSVLWTKRP